MDIRLLLDNNTGDWLLSALPYILCLADLFIRKSIIHFLFSSKQKTVEAVATIQWWASSMCEWVCEWVTIHGVVPERANCVISRSRKKEFIWSHNHSGQSQSMACIQRGLEWIYNIQTLLLCRPFCGVVAYYLASQARDPGIDSQSAPKRFMTYMATVWVKILCLAAICTADWFSCMVASRAYRVASLCGGPYFV